MQRALSKAVSIAVLGFGLVISSPAQAQSTVAGFTSGQHGVGASGDATYSIPIVIPPGRAGIEPSLGFSYSSHAGNGLLGVGFNLHGFSQITRCPKTLAQDGAFGAPDLTTNDRFCLDGQRLVAAAGTYGQAGSQYRMEKDVTTKITYSGPSASPAKFVVKTKDGKTLEYGGSNDATLRSGTTDVWWALKSVTDVYGNQLLISYQNSAGEQYPLQIDYTLNTVSSVPAFNSVKFTYESRPDPQVAYVAGFALRATVRMTAVQAFNGTTKIREYKLSYRNSSASGNSQVTKIQECTFGGSVPAGSCLAPISFAWTPDITPGLQEPAVQTAGFPSTAETYYLGDFNGDGKTDLFVIKAFGGWEMYHATGTGFVSVSSGAWPSTGEKYFLGDFDGDGMTDVFVIPLNGGWKMYRSTGSSIQEVGSGAWPSTLEKYVVGDFNGDGKADLLVLPDAGGWKLYTWTGTALQELASGAWPGKGEKFYVGDFDGDGRSDMFVTPLAGGWKLMLWNGSTFVEKAGGAWPSTAEKYFLGDFNGDGKTDLFVIPLAGGWKMYHSTGVGILEVASGTWPSTLEKIFPGDFNGDGKTDLLVIADQGGWKLYYSTGSNIALKNQGAWPSTAEFYQVDDFGGIGKSEVFVNPMTGGYKYYRAGTNTDQPEAIQTVIKADYAGTGVVSSAVPTVRFEYKSMAASAVYAKGTGAVYPLVDLQPATYVVNQVSLSDGLGTGGVQTKEYTYGGMKSASGTGRGLLGFAYTKERDLTTLYYTYKEFRQDWPFIGYQKMVETGLYSPGYNPIVGRTSTVYVNEGLGGALEYPTNMRYFVYPRYVTVQRWDLDGTAFPTVTTANEFEEPRLVAGALQWGNLTKSTVSTDASDGYSKVTVNQYQPADTNNWIIGRLSRSTVTASAPARTVVTAQPRLSLSNCTSATPTTAPTAATMTCTLSNIGVGAASSVSYTTAANTTVIGPTGVCAANTTCGTVTVTSGPTVRSYTGTLTATPNAGAAASQAINLNVNGSVATLTSGAALALGSANQNAVAPQAAWTLRNDGNAAMTLTLGALNSPFSVVSNGCSAVAPAATCSISVRMATTAAGTFSQSAIAISGANQGNRSDLSIAGSVVASVVLVSTGPVSETWTFTNPNALAQVITGLGLQYGVRVPGLNANRSGGTCAVNASIAPGASCTVTVSAPYPNCKPENYSVRPTVVTAAGVSNTGTYLSRTSSNLQCP
jgi:Salmonella virulence plasmid 65kDa B protein/FG-GAP-like repeat